MSDLQDAYLIGRNAAFELGGVGGHVYFEMALADIDIERLQIAWRRIVARHGALRVVALPDGLQQVLEEVGPYYLEVLDLRDESMEKAAARLEEVRERLSHEVFVLQEWPLFRIGVTLMPSGGTHVHFSIDLFIADLAALRVLLNEWWLLYDEPETQLPSLEIAFRDVVLAERADRESTDYARSVRYWANRLDELTPAPQLPASTAAASAHFTRRTARVKAGPWTKVKGLAAARGVTPSGVLLAAYAVVLGGWSSTQRFTVDVTLFNRPPVHPQVDDVVGDFTNVDLLAVDLVTAESFGDLAGAVQERLWMDLQHAAAGGVQVLRRLAERRRSGPSALAPVVFTSALGGDEDGFASVFGGFGTPVYAITQTPQVYLDHQVFEESGEAVLVWDARDGVLPEGVLDDMFSAYQGLVGRLADPEVWSQPPDIELPGWQRNVRVAVNNTRGPLPSGVLSSLLLERAVGSASADLPAVIAGEQILTFAQLGAAAIGVARTLAAGGIGRGAAVGIGVARGWQQIVATLGATAAGCTYVPIDPALPVARRSWIIDHVGTRCVLTDGAPDVAWPNGVKLVSVGDVAPAAPADVVAWRCPADPDDVAYILYTSGSTGTPKGVAVSHRSALNTLVEVNRRFSVGPADRILGLSSLSFDLSVYDIFGVLAAGGTLVVPETASALDPASWLDMLCRHRVTLWNSVPALMEMLVEYAEHSPGARRLPLRLALLSGDWIPIRLPDRIRALGDDVDVISLGGATEASVWSNAYEIGETDHAWASVPYGFPLRNQTLHVLNERLAPAPAWVRGSLYIGGAGVAAGYHADAERTARSFITHPRTGERLYRTGDLARYRPDGCLEILGREDFQVKIGGFRVELGEIESALSSHPRVAQAVVVAKESGNQRRLVGFVVPSAVTGNGSPVAHDGDLVADDFGDVERDPMARLRFKLGRSGLRRLDGPTITFAEDRLQQPQRRSCRSYRTEPVPAQTLGNLLASLRSTKDQGQFLPRHGYGSPGALYPVQTYVHVRPSGVQDVEPGGYYYDPERHCLVRCSTYDRLPAEMFAPSNRDLIAHGAFSLFLVAQRRAIDPLYGRVARDFCLLESGLMTQLLETSAIGVGLGLCQLGATTDSPALREAFVLDEDHELMHCLVGGLPRHDADHDFEPGQRLEAELRQALSARLPTYMIPARIIVLDSLPLDDRGKVDRQSLIRSDRLADGDGRTFEAPRDGIERIITEVVAEVLGLTRVGANDNFLEIGANSVQLTRIYGKLADRVPRKLALLALFEHPSPRALATWLRDGTDEMAAFEAGRARAMRQRAARKPPDRRRGETEEHS